MAAFVDHRQSKQSAGPVRVPALSGKLTLIISRVVLTDTEGRSHGVIANIMASMEVLDRMEQFLAAAGNDLMRGLHQARSTRMPNAKSSSTAMVRSLNANIWSGRIFKFGWLRGPDCTETCNYTMKF